MDWAGWGGGGGWMARCGGVVGAASIVGRGLLRDGGGHHEESIIAGVGISTIFLTSPRWHQTRNLPKPGLEDSRSDQSGHRPDCCRSVRGDVSVWRLPVGPLSTPRTLQLWGTRNRWRSYGRSTRVECVWWSADGPGVCVTCCAEGILILSVSTHNARGAARMLFDFLVNIPQSLGSTTNHDEIFSSSPNVLETRRRVKTHNS